jgi:hypothetical protein
VAGTVATAVVAVLGTLLTGLLGGRRGGGGGARR